MADAGSHDPSESVTRDQNINDEKVIAMMHAQLPPKAGKKSKEWEREVVDNALLLLFYR